MIKTLLSYAKTCKPTRPYKITIPLFSYFTFINQDLYQNIIYVYDEKTMNQVNHIINVYVSLNF